MPYESILSVAQLAYSTAKSACDYLIKHPIKALTIALSVQSQLTEATTHATSETTDSLVTPYDTYSAFVSEEKPIQAQPICLPLDELYIHYNVITNVPTLEDVNIFLFGEDHHNDQHHILKIRFVNQIAEPGDYVFFEGISNNETPSCDSFCITNEYKIQVFFRKSANDIPSNCKIDLNLNKNLNCLGWEDSDIEEQAISALDTNQHTNQRIENALQKSNEIITGLTEDILLLLEIEKNRKLTKHSVELMKKAILKITKLYKTTLKDYLTDETQIQLNKIKNYLTNTNINNIINSDKSARSIINFIENQTIFLIKKQNDLIEIFNQHFDKNNELLIKQRNEQGLIKSLDAVKDKPNKKFLFAGNFHLFREKDPVDESDLLWTTRQYLNDYRHAILIPKGSV